MINPLLNPNYARASREQLAVKQDLLIFLLYKIHNEKTSLIYFGPEGNSPNTATPPFSVEIHLLSYSSMTML